jgi:ATP-dependent Clp protease protease subunit
MNRFLWLLGISLVITGLVGLSWGATKLLASKNRITSGDTILLQGSVKPTAVLNSKTVHIKKIRSISVPAERTIIVAGEIGRNAIKASQEVQFLNLESNDPIYIILDSPGGSVVDGNMLVSAIEASKAPVYTICHRMCASMAAVIHQYGTKRMMIDRSILMFHPASAGTQGTVEQMKSFSDFLNAYINKTERYIAKRSKMDYDTYKARIQAEVWIDAEDSTLEGFNDEIVSINFENLNKSLKLNDVKKGTNVIEEIKWKK